MCTLTNVSIPLPLSVPGTSLWILRLLWTYADQRKWIRIYFIFLYFLFYTCLFCMYIMYIHYIYCTSTENMQSILYKCDYLTFFYKLIFVHLRSLSSSEECVCVCLDVIILAGGLWSPSLNGIDSLLAQVSEWHQHTIRALSGNCGAAG